METIPYSNFSHYVLRTPLLSFDSFRELTKDISISDDKLLEYCSNPTIMEALFLASPTLHHEIKKWIQKELKINEKLKQSILKYLFRMSTRCTPFGLFAGCSLGRFEHITNIKSKTNFPEINRSTRLDAQFTSNMIRYLIKDPRVKGQTLFYPNNTIYSLGNEIRYLENVALEAGHKQMITSIDSTPIIEKVLMLAKTGKYFDELTKFVQNEEDVELKEASEFIDTLVQNGVLIHDLTPSACGPDYFQQIFSSIMQMDQIDDMKHSLQSVNQKISRIDRCLQNDVAKYEEITNEFKKMKGSPNYCFQTDLFLNYHANSLDRKILKQLDDCLNFLCKISTPNKKKTLTEFKKSFRTKFGNRKIPLSVALDPDIGIGYGKTKASETSPLLNGLLIPKKNSGDSTKKITITSIDIKLHGILAEATVKDLYSVQINDSQFKDYETNWEGVAKTFSCLLEIFGESNPKIKFNFLYGSNSAQYLGRFCYGHKGILKHSKAIIEKENSLYGESILAEIVHHSGNRTSNVTIRPELREYEIPYLSKSLKPVEKQLPVDDLLLSIDETDKLSLHSKKKAKEVIPRLTNAHNYLNSPLPIYQFLCDLQMQDVSKSLAFQWGSYSSSYQFLPRVEYKGIVLKEATWNLNTELIDDFLSCGVDFEKLVALRKEHKIPQYILLGEGDNRLLINLNNRDSVGIFQRYMKNKSNLVITEFLFNEGSIVKSENSYWTNEFLISYYLNQK